MGHGRPIAPLRPGIQLYVGLATAELALHAPHGITTRARIASADGPQLHDARTPPRGRARATVLPQRSENGGRARSAARTLSLGHGSRSDLRSDRSASTCHAATTARLGVYSCNQTMVEGLRTLRSHYHKHNHRLMLTARRQPGIGWGGIGFPEEREREVVKSCQTFTLLYTDDRVTEFLVSPNFYTFTILAHFSLRAARVSYSLISIKRTCPLIF